MGGAPARGRHGARRKGDAVSVAFQGFIWEMSDKVGQRARVRRQGGSALACQGWRENAVHRAGQSLGEWLAASQASPAPREETLSSALRNRLSRSQLSFSSRLTVSLRKKTSRNCFRSSSGVTADLPDFAGCPAASAARSALCRTSAAGRYIRSRCRVYPSRKSRVLRGTRSRTSSQHRSQRRWQLGRLVGSRAIGPKSHRPKFQSARTRFSRHWPRW